MIVLCVPTLTAEEVTFGSGFWPILSDSQLPDQGSITKLIKEAYATVGVTIKRVELPWARILSDINNSPAIIDGGYPFGKTTEREAIYLFSDPVGLATRYVYYNTIRPFHWNTIEDMKGLRIGIVRGAFFGVYQKQLESKIKDNPGFAIIDLSNDELSNFMKLAAGRIDICFCDESQAKHAIAQLPISDQAKIKAAAKPIMNESLLFVMFKNDSHGKKYRDLLNTGLKNTKISVRASEATDATE